MSKNNSNKFVTVVVLNDGQTFTDISGCSICIVPLEQYEEAIRSGGDARDFEPVVEIGLDNMTIPVPQDDDGEEDCNIRLSNTDADSCNIRFSRADADSVSERPLTDAEWNEVKRQYNKNRPADSDWENLTTTVHNVILDSFEDENEDI